VILWSHLRGLDGRPARRVWRRIWQQLSQEDHAAQLVEFAVSLPLLVLFVVGIFDFSGAFTLKQKLTNVARDAARVAAAGPANDLQHPSTTFPISVVDAFQVIENYLVANNINDCSINIGTGTPSGLTWTFTANGNGCPAAGLTIAINRGYYFAAAAAMQPATTNCVPSALGGGPAQTAVIGTCVSIQYAYPWRFGRVANILGSSTVLPSTIAVASVAMNEN
jgi:Flp pilus assembly protein TadG